MSYREAAEIADEQIRFWQADGIEAAEAYAALHYCRHSSGYGWRDVRGALIKWLACHTK